MEKSWKGILMALQCAQVTARILRGNDSFDIQHEVLLRGSVILELRECSASAVTPDDSEGQACLRSYAAFGVSMSSQEV